MKTQGKHTPGRWNFTGSPSPVKEALAIVNDKGIYIADLFAEGAEVGQAEVKEVEANARLIAAAPELLEACKTMVCFCYPNGQWRGEVNMRGILDAIQPAIKAIAKAEGR